MQMNQQQTREDIEDHIEEAREEIYQHKRDLWWFTLGIRTFFIGLLIPIIVWGTPVSQIVFCVVIAVVAVIATIAALVLLLYLSENPGYDEIRSSQESLRVAKRMLVKQQRHLAQYDKHLSNQLPTPEQNAEHLPHFIADYRKRANRYKWRFILVQVAIIVLSVIVTSLSGGWIDRYVLLPWAIPVGSGLISLLSTLLLLFKPKEKGTSLQETADAMDLEFKACGLGLAPYDTTNTREAALSLLAKHTEALRKDQLQRQLSLEQSSQAESKTIQSEKHH